MKNIKKALALILALAMVFALAACGEEPAEETTPTESETPVETEAPNDTLVFATSTFGQKFSPFFATTAYDQDLVNLTQGALLAADRALLLSMKAICAQRDAEREERKLS